MTTDYEHFTLAQYDGIEKVLRSDKDELDRQTAIIAVLSGLSEQEVERLPLLEYSQMAAAAHFLDYTCPTARKTHDTYVLGGLKLKVQADILRLTAAQYIDFQNLAKDSAPMYRLFSCFLVPEGHKYGDGYDFAEVQQAIADNLCLPDALALSAFFLGGFASSIKAILTCSRVMLPWRARMRSKRKQILAMIREAEASLSGGDGFTS